MIQDVESRLRVYWTDQQAVAAGHNVSQRVTKCITWSSTSPRPDKLVLELIAIRVVYIESQHSSLSEEPKLGLPPSTPIWRKTNILRSQFHLKQAYFRRSSYQSEYQHGAPHKNSTLPWFQIVAKYRLVWHRLARAGQFLH